MHTSQASERFPHVKIVGVGAVFTEALLFVFTLLLAITLVVGLTMARRDRYELSLRDRISARGAEVPSYGELVSDYMAGLLQGHLSGADTTPIKRAVMNKALVTAGQRSLQLLGVSLAAALPLGLVWAGLMTNAPSGSFRRALFGGAVLSLALPSFVVLIVLLEIVTTTTQLFGRQVLYTQGYGFDRHLIVPVIVLALRGGAYLALALRSAQEEIARQDYIQVARAKGLGGLRLWRNHTLPLLYLPFVGGVLGTLRVTVGAMILVEYLYNWSGLSKALLQIDQSGFLDYRPEPLEVGAAVLLAIFFVATDALGRLALWGAAVQRRQTEGAR